MTICQTWKYDWPSMGCNGHSAKSTSRPPRSTALCSRNISDIGGDQHFDGGNFHVSALFYPS